VCDERHKSRHSGNVVPGFASRATTPRQLSGPGVANPSNSPTKGPTRSSREFDGSDYAAADTREAREASRTAMVASGTSWSCSRRALERPQLRLWPRTVTSSRLTRPRPFGCVDHCGRRLGAPRGRPRGAVMTLEVCADGDRRPPPRHRRRRRCRARGEAVVARVGDVGTAQLRSNRSANSAGSQRAHLFPSCCSYVIGRFWASLSTGAE